MLRISFTPSCLSRSTLVHNNINNVHLLILLRVDTLSVRSYEYIRLSTVSIYSTLTERRKLRLIRKVVGEGDTLVTWCSVVESNVS